MVAISLRSFFAGAYRVPMADTQTSAHDRPDRAAKRRRRRRRALAFAAVTAAAETAAMLLRGQRPGRNVVVRCRDGHLFTTIWIPAASLKSLRLGLWRLQYCPVGAHWSLVTPVRPAELSDEERSAAAAIRDVQIP
jgi:hypothetical protein